MLEVRLSLEDKIALRNKAASQGLSVSAAVRRLIADYLQDVDPLAAATPHKKVAMTLLQNPRKCALAVAALMASALMMPPIAQAEPIMLSIEIEQSEPTSERLPGGKESFGLRVRRSTTDVEFDDAGEFCMPVAPAAVCDDESGTHVYISPSQKNGGIEIGFKVIKDGDVVAEPTLFMNKGETASFMTGGEYPVLVDDAENSENSDERRFEFKSYGLSLSVSHIDS